MKRVEVRWDAKAYGEYQQLKQRPEKHYQQLCRSLERAIERLKHNPFCGDLIPRKYLNKQIITTYGTDKLFRLPLIGYWRLLYTVVGDKTTIIALLLEYMDHKTYDKRFGYRKK